MAPFYAVGRYGGTAILCRRNLLACVKPIKLNNSRVNGYRALHNYEWWRKNTNYNSIHLYAS